MSFPSGACKCARLSVNQEMKEQGACAPVPSYPSSRLCPVSLCGTASGGRHDLGPQEDTEPWVQECVSPVKSYLFRTRKTKNRILTPKRGRMVGKAGPARGRASPSPAVTVSSPDPGARLLAECSDLRETRSGLSDPPQPSLALVLAGGGGTPGRCLPGCYKAPRHSWEELGAQRAESQRSWLQTTGPLCSAVSQPLGRRTEGALSQLPDAGAPDSLGWRPAADPPSQEAASWRLLLFVGSGRVARKGEVCP